MSKFEYIFALKLKILSWKRKIQMAAKSWTIKENTPTLVLLASLLLSIAVFLVRSIDWTCTSLHYDILNTSPAANYHITHFLSMTIHAEVKLETRLVKLDSKLRFCSTCSSWLG